MDPDERDLKILVDVRLGHLYDREVGLKQEHFEVMLERVESHIQIVLEAVQATREALTLRMDGLDKRMDTLDHRMDRFEVSLAEVKVDVRDIKRTVGLLHSIANDHESRLQSLEGNFQDHLGEHKASTGR